MVFSTHIRSSLRRLHSSIINRSKLYEEIKIPVPWGYVAGKWWGPKSETPVLAVHGWMDNACSFDPLLKLTPGASVLAIDLPGSGLSSHLPPFYNYHFIDSALVLRKIQEHLMLKPVALLGHSGGSSTCFLYAALYPELVTGYFALDYIFYAYKSHDKRASCLGELLDDFIKFALRDPRKNRLYSEDDLQQQLSNPLFTLSQSSSNVLMKRRVVKVGEDQFAFTHDQRTKLLKSAILSTISVDEALQLAKNVNCHIRIVKSKEGPFLKWGLRNCPSLLPTLENASKSYKLHEVDGGHHLHMDHADQVAPIFAEFLQAIKC